VKVNQSVSMNQRTGCHVHEYMYENTSKSLSFVSKMSSGELSCKCPQGSDSDVGSQNSSCIQYWFFHLISKAFQPELEARAAEEQALDRDKAVPGPAARTA
jgi:hypothetical protein